MFCIKYIIDTPGQREAIQNCLIAHNTESRLKLMITSICGQVLKQLDRDMSPFLEHSYVCKCGSQRKLIFFSKLTERSKREGKDLWSEGFTKTMKGADKETHPLTF